MKKTLLTSLLLSVSLWADSTLAPSRLEVKDGYNMYLEGQFLWWILQTDTLPICQDGAIAPSTFKGNNKRMHTDFKPGWRATFGGLMAYDHWDIHFTWTHFNQRSRASTENSSWYLGNSLGNPSLASYVRSHYSLDLNMIDAIMTRPSWMGERLAISPFFGARGTWLDQHFATRAGLTPVAGGGSIVEIKNHAKSDFRGAGLLAGFNLRYELKGGWSIEGNFLTSGVYGKFVNYFDASQAGIQQDFSKDPHQSLLFDIEYKLGFAYNRFIYKGRYHLGGGIGWEQLCFINGNRLPIWSNGIIDPSGNLTGLAQTNPSTLLSVQGITLRLDFGF